MPPSFSFPINPRPGFWFLALVLLSACGPSPADRLRALAPELTPEAARALTGTDAEFRNYCRRAGAPAIFAALGAITWYHVDDPDFVSRYFRAAPENRRLCDCLEHEYALDGPRRRLDMLLGLSPRELSERLAWTDAYQRIGGDRSIPPRRRLDLLQTYLDTALERPGMEVDAGRILTLMAGAKDALGDIPGELACDQAAFRIGRRGGMQRSHVGLVGTIGYDFAKLGEVDSMLVYYEQAMELARRSRLPGEYARIAKFLAGFYEPRGKFSAAAAVMDDALRYCREQSAGADELMYLLPRMSLLARLGGWDVIGDDLERSRILLRNNHGYFDQPKTRSITQDLDLLEGRRAFALGDPGRAQRIFTSSRDAVRAEANRQRYAYFLECWVRGLLDNDLPDNAVGLVAEGRAYTDSLHLPVDRLEFATLEAETDCRLGRFDDASGALSRFRELAGSEAEVALRSNWVSHDAVSIRCARAAGDRAALDASAQTAMARMERMLAQLEPSAEAYLFLESSRDLLDALHETVAGDPAAGYGLETWWRSLPRFLGTAEPAPKQPGNRRREAESWREPTADLAAALARYGDRTASAVRERGAVHAVYRMTPDAVLRWTVTEGGVRMDILEPSPKAMKEEIKRAVAGLADRSRRSPPDRDLSRRLASLARTLLPREVASPGEGDAIPFLISPDGELRSLPFATLNVGTPPEYRPLGAEREVAELGFPPPALGAPPADAPGLIVADPGVAPSLRRRYPSLEPLPSSRDEARIMLAASPPGTRLLEGGDATRAALLAAAPGASFLYLSAHFVRDPQSPYLVFLPLAADGPAERPEDMSLDLTDVLGLKLGRCALTTLSGCGTGAPYTTSIGTAPSLADAFLVAGSRTVVHTFWDVDDDEAAAFMSGFSRRLRDGILPARALNQTRAEAIRNGLPPGIWGTFGVKQSAP